MTAKSCFQRTSIASNWMREGKKMTNQINHISHFWYFHSLLFGLCARNTNGALFLLIRSSLIYRIELLFALRPPIRTLSISTNKSINMKEVSVFALVVIFSPSFFRFLVEKMAAPSRNPLLIKSNERQFHVLTTY